MLKINISNKKMKMNLNFKIIQKIFKNQNFKT